MASASIGSALRAERRRQGKELVAIEIATKIRRGILSDIENDRFERLPRGIYRRSFLRQYARALALDAEEMLAAFGQEYEEWPLPLPTPRAAPPRRRFHGTAWLLVGILGCVGMYKFTEARRADSVQTVTLSPTSLPQSEPERARISETSAPTPLQIALTAVEPVWLSVKCDGEPTFTGTLVETANRIFNAFESVTVLIGNAGGLTDFGERPRHRTGRATR